VAEENDSASKTEEPTGRRLEQAREKGDVPKTLDLPQVAVFAAVGSANWDTACECLSLGCYGWLQLVGAALVILAIVRLSTGRR
jgi:flagellar biosynthesis protein FlhB